LSFAHLFLPSTPFAAASSFAHLLNYQKDQIEREMREFCETSTLLLSKLDNQAKQLEVAARILPHPSMAGLQEERVHMTNNRSYQPSLSGLPGGAKHHHKHHKRFASNNQPPKSSQTMSKENVHRSRSSSPFPPLLPPFLLPPLLLPRGDLLTPRINHPIITIINIGIGMLTWMRNFRMPYRGLTFFARSLNIQHKDRMTLLPSPRQSRPTLLLWDT
jgi:hypothetical protein